MREQLEQVIETLHHDAINADSEGKRAYSANALSGVIKKYVDVFGAMPEDVGTTKLKAISDKDF